MIKKLVPVLSLGLMFLAGSMAFAAPTATSTTKHHASKMQSHHHVYHHVSHHHVSHHHVSHHHVRHHVMHGHHHKMMKKKVKKS